MSKEHPSVEHMLHDFTHNDWDIHVAGLATNTGIIVVHKSGEEISHVAKTFTEALALAWSEALTFEFSPDPSIVSWDIPRVIVAEDDGAENEVSWEAFCSDNSEFPDMLWEARKALGRHGRYVGGGGASPVFTVTRVVLAPASAPASRVAPEIKHTLPTDMLLSWIKPEWSKEKQQEPVVVDDIQFPEKPPLISTWFSPECQMHSKEPKPFDPLSVLQDFEECGGPEGEEYIATMRSIAAEATRRADAYQAIHARELEIKALQPVADALWELRGRFNGGRAHPGDPATSIAAKILESFASYVACLASDGEYDEDTFSGFYNNLHNDLGYTVPSKVIK